MKNKIIGLVLIVLGLAACTNETDRKHSEHTGDLQHAQQGIGPRALMDAIMENMHQLKSSGNNDLDYAAMMIEHHKGAVIMSELQLENGVNEELKRFSRQVIDDQEREIKLLDSVLTFAPKTPSPDSDKFNEELAGSMKAMMSDGTRIYGDQDKDFAAQMIQHHQSAVDMANLYLRYGSNDQLVALSRSIITSQSAEINWLKDWLAG